MDVKPREKTASQVIASDHLPEKQKHPMIHTPTPAMAAEINQHEMLLSSYLLKRNKSHNWQKKWFVLRRNQLSYYKNSKEYKALRVINMEEILSFNEIPDNHRFHFIIVTNERIFHLKATDKETYDKWISLLGSLVNTHDDNYDDNDNDNGKDKDKDNNKHTMEGSFNFARPVLNTEAAMLPSELQGLQLSGTDDNFTSGDNEYNTSSRNQSSTSINQLPMFEIPASIIEEDKEDVTMDTSNHPLPTVYYNSLASSSPDHIISKGHIYRLKKRYNQWKKYYMLLTNHFLFFFKTTKDYEQSKIYKKINVNDILDVVELDPLSRTKLHCMLIITPSKRIRFCAETEADLTRWLVLLKTLIKTRKEEKSV
jgi:hypothetical protein